jgi:hypothetical protein
VRSSTPRLALAGLLSLYLATRLVSLTSLPIFFDETGHIRWAIWISQGQKIDKPWQYGKGLPIFASALLFPWAGGHYLWASRALTVAFGAGTLVGTVLLGRRLGGRAAGGLAGLVYVACPYALFYDRLALTDPALGTFAVFVAVFSLDLAEKWRWRDGAAVGLALALAVFSKALGALVFFAPAAAVLIVAPRRLRRPGPLLVAYAIAAGLTAYPLLRYVQVTATLRVAVEKSDAPLLARLAGNLPLCASWLWGYWTVGLLALAVWAVARAALVRAGPVLFVALFIVMPLLALAAVGDIWFPRYLVFLNGPFAALAAWGAHEAAAAILARWPPALARPVVAAGLALALLPALHVDLRMLADPARAPLVDLDRFQFVTGWPSGYGVRDTLAFVRAERARRPAGIRVVTHSRTVRTTARALDLDFAYDQGARIDDLNFDQPEGAMPLLAEWARERPTLVVIEPPQAKSRRPSPELFAPLGGALVARTYKPDGELCDEIYRLYFDGALAAAPSARAAAAGGAGRGVAR